MRRCAFLWILVALWASCSPEVSTSRQARALGPSSGMVISQIYGGGGNSGAVLKYDYVELFNRGAAAVTMTGWSVQYAGATSNNWSVHALPNLTVSPGRYYLVQLDSYDPTVGVDLPVTADSVGTLALGASNGKVALLNTATTCGAGCASNAAVVDLVGYGSANESEGSAASGPASNNQVLVRKSSGCTETDSNANDFDIATWTSALTLPLHNGASTAAPCATVDAGVDAPPTVDQATPPPAGAVVISQIYGAGGNSGAKYTNDYVELFNRSKNAVPIGGWSVQYGSSASAFAQKADIPAGASIGPGKYYLVQLGGGTTGTALPAPDATATFNISASAGKIALVSNGTQLTCGTATDRCTGSGIVDLVGYGGAADYEGTAAAAPSSSTQGLFRRSAGCVDSGDNSADFEVKTAEARNSGAPMHDCSVDAGTPDATPAVDTKPAADSGPMPPSGEVVISQIYGAGGNASAKYTNDYVELFNRSKNAVPIGGWSVQYGSSASAFSQKVDLPAGASIGAGKYYLVQLGSGGAAGTALPAADATGTINLAASAGKVALVASTTQLTCGTATDRCTGAALMDLVGWGGAADYEGTAAAAPSSSTQAIFRRNAGCVDTGNNATDLEVLTAEARNSASPQNDCAAAADAGPPPDLAGVDAKIPDQRVADKTPSSDSTSTVKEGGTVADSTKPVTDAAQKDAIKPAEKGVLPSYGVVISQIYAAGGNSGAKYTNDYVELFNRGKQTATIGGWSIQYGSAAANFAQKVDIPAGSLPPGGYFLIKLGGGSAGIALPDADLAPTGTTAFNMGASAGKVALVRSATQLACGAAGSRCSSTEIEDLVGYGNAADYEGAGPAAATSSATSALHRKNAGCTDTNQNVADFASGPADPRNSASPVQDCSKVPDAGAPKADLAGIKADAPSSTDAVYPDTDLVRSDSSGKPPVKKDEGCACRVSDASSSAGAPVLVLFAVVMMLVRRRRAR